MLEAGLSDGTFIYTRRAYGWYTAGGFTFLAGRTDNWQGGAGAYWPQQKLVQGPTPSEAWGWGKAWHPRMPKLQLTWRSGALGFQASLEKPIDMPLNYPVGGVDVVSNFPGVGLALDYSGKSFSATPAFIWTQWQAKGDTAGFDDSLNAYGFILPFAFKAGGFKLILEAHYAVNPAGLYQNYNTYGRAVTADMGFEDTRLWGGLGEASYTAGKTDPGPWRGAGILFQRRLENLPGLEGGQHDPLAGLAGPALCGPRVPDRPPGDRLFQLWRQPGNQNRRRIHLDFRRAVQIRVLGPNRLSGTAPGQRGRLPFATRAKGSRSLPPEGPIRAKPFRIVGFICGNSFHWDNLGVK